MGNLTRDPETRHTPGGNAVTQFGLAINHNYTTAGGEKREEVTFVDVTFFGKRGEVIAQYLKKGNPIFVEGRLRLEQWEDKQTQQKKSKLTVVGDSFEFLGGKQDERPASRPAQAPDDEIPL